VRSIIATPCQNPHKGPSIKDVRTKLQKVDPLPPCSQNVRTVSIPYPPHPPPCPCGHTINFEKPDIFCTKKCGHPHLKTPSLSEKCPHRKNLLPLTADVLYRRPLISDGFSQSQNWTNFDLELDRFRRILTWTFD